MRKINEARQGPRAVAREDFVHGSGAGWTLSGHLRELGRGALSLVRGMGVTIGYLASPSRVITQEYPENRERLTMFPRFRGRLDLVLDEESGAPRCTACGMCEKACPNGSISVLTSRDAGGRKVLGRYLYRLSQCTLCNLCVESCPFDAIRMSQEFELAAYSREELTLPLYGREA